MYKMFIIHDLHLLYTHFGVLQTNVIIESNLRNVIWLIILTQLYLLRLSLRPPEFCR